MLNNDGYITSTIEFGLSFTTDIRVPELLRGPIPILQLPTILPERAFDNILLKLFLSSRELLSLYI